MVCNEKLSRQDFHEGARDADTAADDPGIRRATGCRHRNIFSIFSSEQNVPFLVLCFVEDRHAVNGASAPGRGVK